MYDYPDEIRILPVQEVEVGVSPCWYFTQLNRESRSRSKGEGEGEEERVVNDMGQKKGDRGPQEKWVTTKRGQRGLCWSRVLFFYHLLKVLS